MSPSSAALSILALDLSLTATGWAGHRPGPLDLSGCLTTPQKVNGLERLAYLRDECIGMADGCALVVIEGLAFAAHNSMKDEIAGLHYVVRLALHEAGYPIALIPPSTLKKFGTGRGNAKKEEMLAEAIRRLGYQGSNHNEADALWLVTAAQHHYGVQRADLPKPNLEALAKVSWPALSGVTA